MSLRPWVLGLALTALAAAALAGYVATGGTDPAANFRHPVFHRPVKPARKAAKAKGPLGAKPAPAPLPAPVEPAVDEGPLRTAKLLAGLAATPDERDLAQQAVRLANHEVDLAFADALREAAAHPPTATPALQALMDARAAAQDAVAASQREIARLGQAVAKADGARKESLSDQLEVAKAQLDLDQDELQDAVTSLEQAGGDPQAWIRRLRAAHDAAQNEPLATPLAAPAQGGSLVGRLREWLAQRTKLARLEQAREAELQKAQVLRQRRDAVAREVARQRADRQATKQWAAGFVKERARNATRMEAEAAISTLQHFMDAQRTLASLGRRLQDEEDLATVYDSWAGLAWAYGQLALHRLLASVLAVLGVLLAVFLVMRLARRSRRALREGQRGGTAASILSLGSLGLGLLIIVFVVLGVPAQTTTVLGLAGAGLTVALKDFIVAFFGWFVLMGRNGIHVGDWVEIKGVGGEVVEIGLLRTVLLETGSWSDAGHPTGRRVAFVNSFAIEGHYFNFSTSGQWMWDELNVLIPPGQDPYPIIDGIQKLVTRETEANARLAEEEWKHATGKYRVQAFSAQPGINVRPTSNGIEVRVRYITRAYQRHEDQRGLYQAVVELMHGRRPEDAPAAG